MCGIAGLYQRSPQPIHAMCKKIAHRGPDASGIFHQPPVTLGHQRLSIIDLSDAANQPFTKNSLTIVFNGEIYNYAELANELKASGIQFVTHSDTEVILEAWRQWGPKSLSRFRGMFSFALYDERTQTLYLARDPFGIKPLFIHRQSEGLAFASEIKALLPAVHHTEINPQALVTHLLYLWLPDDQCIYQHIEKFPAGYYAEIRPDQPLQFHTYTDLFNRPADPMPAPANPIETLRAHLEDSVKAHMVADVPVSVLLSGGLDSSLIAALAANHHAHIEAYTIAFRNQDKRFEAMPDDVTYARQVAQHFDLSLHEIEITPDIVDLWPRIISTLDEPIGDAASINTYLICQAAQQNGAKVLLSGMGADELFAGYRKHYACLLANRFRRWIPSVLQTVLPKLVQHLPVAGRHNGYRTLRWLKRFLSFASLNEEAAFRRSYSYYAPNELQRLLHPSYQGYIDPPIQDHTELYWQYAQADQINRMCYVDTQWFLRGLNLTYCDRASMAASTEVRVPFVDPHLGRFALNLPGNYKIYKGQTKALLKEAARAWLPDHIIDRPKAGFAAPLRAWIRHDLKTMVDDYLLSDNGLAKRQICQPEVIRRMIREDRSGRSDNAQRLWQLLTLELWFRQNES